MCRFFRENCRGIARFKIHSSSPCTCTPSPKTCIPIYAAVSPIMEVNKFFYFISLHESSNLSMLTFNILHVLTSENAIPFSFAHV